jgi:hypothetical protein
MILIYIPFLFFSKRIGHPKQDGSPKPNLHLLTFLLLPPAASKVFKAFTEVLANAPLRHFIYI